jgi:hypothetical protein
MRVDLDGGQGSGGSGRRRWVDQGGEPVVRRDRGSNYKLASIPPALDPSLSWRGAFGCERRSMRLKERWGSMPDV